jgi:hypothetical protein
MIAVLRDVGSDVDHAPGAAGVPWSALQCTRASAAIHGAYRMPARREVPPRDDAPEPDRLLSRAALLFEPYERFTARDGHFAVDHRALRDGDAARDDVCPNDCGGADFELFLDDQSS